MKSSNFLHLPRLVGHVERQDELADLARVAAAAAADACWAPASPRSRPRWRSGCVAAAIRQGQDLLVADDLLDFLEPLLVMGQDRITDELLFLERLDHVAVVGRWQTLLPGDLGGDVLHLALDLGERLVRLGGELAGGMSMPICSS